MTAILKREINSFFASPIAYLVVGAFLLLNSLFLWVFKGNFNIFDNGFADLNSFFQLSPWILIFLIPSITMKSFSDEKKLGTLELLLTKPISPLEIVLGKYLGAFILTIITLLPTLLYVVTIWKLGNPTGNIDMGSTIGSYSGLLFLSASYTSIGIFTSTLSGNQIVAFIMAVLICFIFYYGFEGISGLFGNKASFLTDIGMKVHFDSISRGVIDSRDLIYFVSVCILFIVLTTLKITPKQPS